MTVSALLHGGPLHGDRLEIADEVAASWSRSQRVRLLADPDNPLGDRKVCTYQRAAVDEDPLRYEFVSEEP